MTQEFRTPSGGRIRRDQPIRFMFDGRSFDGYAGDTLASALLAHGVHLVGRSFKYHRPRGIMSAGSEEPNALVTIDRGDGRITPNLRATAVELYDGLTARTQNAWPSVRFDLGAVAGALSPLLSAGFYYKTFMWPTSFWRRLYEPAIRAAAGLGKAPTAADPDRYLHRYAHCDVLVVGAGPAGLAAAAAANARGDRVILCDEQAEPGGSLLARPDVRIDGSAAADWIAGALDGSTVLTRTTAFGWYPDNMIALTERVTDHLARPALHLPRERLWLIRAKRVVIAAGAIERPAVFPGNDRPGIMLAGAAHTYLHRYGVLPGRRIVVAASHDSAWFAAFAMAAAGATVAAILDRRDVVDPALREQARAAGIPFHLGARITRHRRAGGAFASCGPTAVRRSSLRYRVDVGRLDAVGALVFAVARGTSFRSRQRHISARVDPRRASNPSAPAPEHSIWPPASPRDIARAAAIPGPSTSPAIRLSAPRRRRRPAGRTARRSLIFRTTSPPRISRSPPAKGSARSSMSNATPPPGWRRIRARPRT